jgi:rubrerythrin
MPIEFNADEIFEIAEQIERNGAEFYRTVADGAAAKKNKAMLLELAGMEVDHEKTFRALRAELAAKPKDELAYDPEGQAALYLQAFADGYVFAVKVDPAERLTGKESMADILTTAIGLEKDSIAFYVGMGELVARDLGKDKIEHIIREEMGHVRLLSERLAAV